MTTHAPVRLLALDMDGTLLRSDLTISPRNQAAVAACLDRGITVVLATGRFYTVAVPYCAYWPDRPIWIAANNGAQLFAPGESRPMLAWNIDLALAQEVLSWIDGRDITARVYFTDTAVINRPLDSLPRFVQLLAGKVRYEPNLAPAVTEPPAKISLLTESRAERIGLEAEVRKRWGDRLEITGSEHTSIELTAPGATKGEAIRALAERLGIDRRHVAAIGNARNDLAMVTWAGLGAAVANAHEELLAAAPRVVAHHDEDGVGEFIESFLND